VIEHATRRIRILGATPHPAGEWTTRQARNLFMDLGEQADRVKFMIRDRGSNFTDAFDAVLADAGIRTVRCNVRTPRMNAIAAGSRPSEPLPQPGDLDQYRIRKRACVGGTINEYRLVV
jgi:hypothetical protein